MGKQREFEGRTLQEALAAASAGTGIAEPELDYKILEQGRRGLFGIGAKSVRIRVMPPLVGPESLGDPRDVGGRSVRGDREGRGARRGRADRTRGDGDGAAPAGDGSGEERGGDRPPKRRRRRRRRRSRGGADGENTREASASSSSAASAASAASTDGAPASDGRAAEDGSGERSEGGSRRRRRRRGGRGRRGRGEGRGNRREGRGRESGGNRSRRRRPPAEPVDVSTEDLARVRDTAQKMVELMRLDLTIEAEAVETGVRLRCEGEDLDVLSRDDGEVAGALRFVLNRMGRRAWPDAGRVQLKQDGGGAIDERDEEVLETVREVVQQVRNTGQSKRLHPMNAYERRLVHIEVRASEGVGSRSEGDGDLKRVTIYPQDETDSGNDVDSGAAPDGPREPGEPA